MENGFHMVAENPYGELQEVATASAAGANPGDEQERWDFSVGV